MMSIPCEHCCHEPSFKAVEQQQQPYRGQWQAIVAWANERQQAGHPIYPDDLVREIHRIADIKPDATEIFAYRTTRYGRDGEAE